MVVLMIAVVLLTKLNALCPTILTFTSGPKIIELKLNTATSVPALVYLITPWPAIAPVSWRDDVLNTRLYVYILVCLYVYILVCLYFGMFICLGEGRYQYFCCRS